MLQHQILESYCFFNRLPSIIYSKDKGNKLEQEVFQKLQSVNEISQVKADALMFYHVYADLVLQKTAFDMNKHYHELVLFLETVQKTLHINMNKNVKVFESEGRLYSNQKKTSTCSAQ